MPAVVERSPETMRRLRNTTTSGSETPSCSFLVAGTTGQPPCATMPEYWPMACSTYIMVSGEKIGRFEATLSPWPARASNSSSQLPRRSDFRISPITSCALARPATATAASIAAPERKKRLLALIVIPCTLVVAEPRAWTRTLRWPPLTIGQPSRLKPATAPLRGDAAGSARPVQAKPITRWGSHGNMAAAWPSPHTMA